MELQRDCLYVDITDFDTLAYSYLYFAFAEVSNDYNVNISIL